MSRAAAKKRPPVDVHTDAPKLRLRDVEVSTVSVPAHAGEAATAQKEGEQTLALLTAKPVKVRNAEHFAEVSLFAREAADRRRALDAMRKHVTDPLNEALKRVNDLFRPGITAWRVVEEHLKGALASWQLAQAEAERLARLEAAELATAKGKGASRKLLAALQAADEHGTAKAEGMQTRLTWIPKVTDEALIPRKFLLVNHKALAEHGAAAKDSLTGPEPVPGVIYERDATMVAGRVRS